MTPNRLRELRLQRIELLCAFAYYELGETSLINTPVMLMGYRSLARSTLFASKQVALENLRRCCHGLGTLAALRAAAGRYNDSVIAPGTGIIRFEINEKTLAFEPVLDFLSGPLQQALEELKRPPERQSHNLKLAQTDAPMFIRVPHEDETQRYALENLPENFALPAQHPSNGSKAGPIKIAWLDLIEEARQMDAIDKRLSLPRPGNWEQRLLATSLKSAGDDGTLIDEPEITLTGLKHLIGLPGAGKTTLLVCVLRYLGIRGVKTAVFFPSIEVCRQYLEDLRRYDVGAGLLVGQSRDSKQAHAAKLGESLATNDPLRGFGLTTPSANLFEGVCALPRLTSAPPGAFSINDQFCRNVLQRRDGQKGKSKKEFVDRLCPAWSLCSRNRSARELPNTAIWMGHIRSADTHVPPHTTPYNERYFELIAREFDVVIFDEADNAQQALDMSGISQLKLSGYRSSFHQQIQEESLQHIAMGANSRLRDEGYVQFSLDCAEFEKFNINLVSAIHRLDDSHRRTLSGLLLTPLRLIGDWLTPKRQSALQPSSQQDPRARAKGALAFVWEHAAIRAFQFRSDKPEQSTKNPEQWRRMAQSLQQPLATLGRDADKLQGHLAAWLNAPTLRDRTEQEEAIEALLVPYLRSGTPGDVKMLVRLLISVTFTVLSYRRLVFRLDALSKDGVIRPIRVDERCSDDLLLACPDNLLGSLSGVRFFTELRVSATHEGDHDIQLQYVVFSGAPRAFMYRLHEWTTHEDGSLHSGPAVLLTSATSYLPASPAFHVNVEPSYLLHRKEAVSGNSRSAYALLPIPDRDSPLGEALRYSGVRSESVRLNNLCKMADALLDGWTASRVVQDCRDFDVRGGIARKAAFVVNSYEQSLALKQHIDQRWPSWRDRTVAVVDKIPHSAAGGGYVTASMVESLGDKTDWDLLIFPMGALGRGTNIVFSGGARQRDATIGSMYFLTRPHPSPDDLNFLVSLGARATIDFDHQDLTSVADLEEFSEELRRARGRLYQKVGHLLRHPLYARTLGKDLFAPFTANIAVPLLQTIGRAMRNGCPAQCFFVDRSWAEESSKGRPDNEVTSMLVQLRKILEQGVRSENKRESLLFQELYGPFLEPLSNVNGLITEEQDKGEEDEKDDGETSPLWGNDSPVEGDD